MEIFVCRLIFVCVFFFRDIVSVTKIPPYKNKAHMTLLTPAMLNCFFIVVPAVLHCFDVNV